MSWLPPVVTAAPASEPVTVDEVKTHTRYDGSANDSWITGAIKAARRLVEDYTGTKVITQTVVMRCSSFCDFAKLPLAPVASVTSITYLDSAGAEQTLSTDVYETVLIGLEPSIRLKIGQSWPTTRPVSDAIRVTAVVGTASANDDIKHAIFTTVSSWDQDRDANDLPPPALAILENTRRF